MPVIGVKSVSLIYRGKIIHNANREPIEDLDILPFPARHLLEERNAYYNPKLGKRPFTAVYTSRGCSYQCIYCVPSSLSFSREIEYKHYQNKKPPSESGLPENIIEEFYLLKSQGYKAVNVQDDQFVWGEERTVQICEGIKDLGIIWGCAARSDHLNEPIVKAMAASNCKFIDLGVESFNQAILDSIKKDIEVKKHEEAITLIRKYGISAKINVMFGASPLETMDTIRKTMSEVKRLKVDQVMYNIANPFPGTEFYTIAKENKLFVYGDYKPVNVAKEANIAYPHLDKASLEKAVRRANFAFFLTPRFILKNILRIGSLRIPEGHAQETLLTMKFSILVPAYNEEGSIASSLDSLVAIEHPDMEIIVIRRCLNRRHSPCRSRFSRQGVVLVAREKNGGRAAALNAGLQRAVGDVIITTDADTMVPSGWLKSFERQFEQKGRRCRGGALIRPITSTTHLYLQRAFWIKS